MSPQGLQVALCYVALLTAGRPTSAETLLPEVRGLEEASIRAIATSFEHLAFDPGDEFRRMLVPNHIDALDGRRIRIRGYMWPSFQQRGIRQFILNDRRQMKFGGVDFAADEAIRVTVKQGLGANYTAVPVVVEGRIFIDPLRGETRIVSLYRIDNASVYSIEGDLLVAPLLESEAAGSAVRSPAEPN